MKRLLLLLPLLVLSWCWIQKWDTVTCVAWVQDFVWEVMYKQWKYIALSWVNNFYQYFDSSNCPVELDEYWTCAKETSKTWEWILNIEFDMCYRQDNYRDLIRLKKLQDWN